jgi:hypothetical protein
MAAAVVASEALVAFGLYAVLKIKNLDPVVIAGSLSQVPPVSTPTRAAAQP